MEQTQLKPVIYVASDRLSRTYNWESDSVFLKSGIDIISVKEIDAKLRDNNIVVPNTDIHNEGAVYIKHPYLKGQYMKANRDQVDVFDDVFHAMSDIVQNLGITRMSANITLENASERTIQGCGAGKFKTIEARLDLQEYREKLARRANNLCMEYSNPKIDYDAALEEANKSGLISMPKVASWLKQRSPYGGGSTLKKYNITVDISEDMNENIDIAFSLGFMKVFKNGIDVNYSESFKKRYKMHYELVIEF